jgi:peroxiredoxin family protein
MTELLERPATLTERPTIEKVSIIVSKGSLEGVYPALIMANGARMEGIEADLFFTFFGIDAIRRGRNRHIKVATVGNPGMHMPTLLGALPGFSAIATRMMQRQMEKLDIPPIPEFVELLDAGYDGHSNCFIETGFHRALLIDFNYDTEPLPGHFPTAIGLPLLRESRLNHLGKLMFQWAYWHALLPGREIPGVGSTMPTAGKRAPAHA